MNQYQALSPIKVMELQADIRRRIGLQHTLAEHTRPVLAMEFGLALNTVIAIENGETQNSRSPADVVAEIRRRRAIWRLTDEQMDDYTLQALADKYGVCVNTVVNQAREVRYGGHMAQEQAA